MEVGRLQLVRTPAPKREADRPVAKRRAGDPDPHELAKRAGAGDTEATARLVKLLAPEMLRVVRGVMGPHAAEVEDAAQQALIGLVLALPAFRGECAVAGYACRIALRTALTARKGARKRQLRHDGAADMSQFPTSPAGGPPPEERRRTELLRRLLEEIPKEQAEALALRTMLGWSIEEIARAGGVPINTVRSRLRLAKEALRKKIEKNPSVAEELGVRP